MLRIRPDNGTIRELNIPKEKLEVLQKVVSSQTTEDVKKLMIKKFAEVSQCCICGGIPSLEVVYDIDGATLIERYCDACLRGVYETETVKTPEDYGLVIGDTKQVRTCK